MMSKLKSGSILIPLTIVAFISIFIVVIYSSRTYFQIQERYATVANEIHQKTQTLIDEKKEAILLIALSMGNDLSIKNALLSNDPGQLRLNEFSRELKKYTLLKNIWFQVINNNADSFYRSWTNKRGDNVLKARLDIEKIIKEPGIKTSISTGLFDITFKAMVPIYSGETFLGVFEVIAKFNSIADKLVQEGIDPVFLVDKRYRKQLKKPFTKKFVNDYYVANLNVKDNYLQMLKANELENYIRPEDNFMVDEQNGLLSVYFELPDVEKKAMGHFILFKPLKNIAIDDIYESRNRLILYFALLAILLFVILRYAANLQFSRKVNEINHHLEEKITAKNSELISQGRFLQNVLDGVSDSVMVIDKGFNVSMMNKAARTNAEKSLASENDIKCYKLSHHLDVPCDNLKYKCPHKEVFTTGKTSKVVHNHFSFDGKSHYVEITATPLFNELGEVEAIIEMGHDISTHMMIHEQLEKQKDRLDHQAHHDALTGLPNRILLIDRLHQAIKLAQRNHTKVAVLFIDLDRFKEINDTLGHSVGDEVLIEIAKRLKNSIRNVDTVARLGGDEFTLILCNIERVSVIMEIAQKLIDILGQKVIYGENELYITASIGISLYPDDGDSSEILLRNSDSAMYQAKDIGRNNYQFYTQEMTEQAFERILLEKNLRRAIKQEEFIIFYQPQYNSRSNEIIGMEALLRWQHPEMGLVSPAKFIPIAEETGLIIAIGWLVIDQVIQQVLQWSAAGYCNGHVSINLSVKQIQEKDFIRKVLEGLDKLHYKPEYIQFEVTESYIMTDPELAIKTLQQLKDLNYTISIDDFGTGYSSLSYLKRLPVDELKIDQSFVRDVPGDEEDEAIVRSIISLAQSMNLNVIAEGVETKQQQEFLLAENCENIQGYLVGRPVNAEEMTKILRKKNG